MGDWYQVIKTINGCRYIYRQKTWREGTHVRTCSEYVGPAGGAAALDLTLQKPRPPAPLGEAEAGALWERGESTELRAGDLIPKFSGALKRYSNTGYESVNKALRADIPLTSAIKNEILRLKGALEHPKAVMAADVALYRGALVRADKLRVGAEFEDFAFLSFSLERRKSLSFLNAKAKRGYVKVFYKLFAYKGEKGYIQMSEITDFPHEKEILCRGSRFKIVEIIEEEGIKTCLIERLEKTV